MKNYKRLIVIIAVLISCSTNWNNVYRLQEKQQEAVDVMRISYQQPVSLDPPNCYESEGIQVIRQVWDGLFDL